MSYIDVRDFASAVVGDDWAPAIKLAITAAVEVGYAGVVVPTIGAPYIVRRPAGPAAATQHRPLRAAPVHPVG